MVQVNVRLQNEQIQEIEISGHAEHGEYPNDLVCAAISCIAFGLLNALEELQIPFQHVIEENRIVMRTEDDDSVLKVGYYQLKTIEERYPKSIHVKKVEV